MKTEIPIVGQIKPKAKNIAKEEDDHLIPKIMNEIQGDSAIVLHLLSLPRQMTVEAQIIPIPKKGKNTFIQHIKVQALTDIIPQNIDQMVAVDSYKV